MPDTQITDWAIDETEAEARQAVLPRRRLSEAAPRLACAEEVLRHAPARQDPASQGARHRPRRRAAGGHQDGQAPGRSQADRRGRPVEGGASRPISPAALTWTPSSAGCSTRSEQSGHADNTIIILWSDHGWTHGQKEHWRKFSLWEQDCRVVFMIAAPGVTHARHPLRAHRQPVRHLPDRDRPVRRCRRRRGWRATACCRCSKNPQRDLGPPVASRRTAATTTASATRSGATSATPTAARSCTTTTPTRWNGRTWRRSRSGRAFAPSWPPGCPK